MKSTTFHSIKLKEMPVVARKKYIRDLLESDSDLSQLVLNEITHRKSKKVTII